MTARIDPPGWSVALFKGPRPLAYFRGPVRIVTTDLLDQRVREASGIPTGADREGWVILAPGARNPITGKPNSVQVVELHGRPRVFDTPTAAARHAEQAGWIQ